MSRDKRGNGIQEVDGSIPFGSTNSNRDKSLAQPGEPVISRVPDVRADDSVVARASYFSRALFQGRSAPHHGGVHPEGQYFGGFGSAATSAKATSCDGWRIAITS